MTATNKHLAEIYSTSERQIGRWKAEGANLLDLDSMTMFWVSRRSFPRHLHSLSDAQRLEMQKALSAFVPSTDAASGWTWMDDLRAASLRLCDIEGYLCSVATSAEPPAAVRAAVAKVKAANLTFIDLFHDTLIRAGVSEDDILTEPNWQDPCHENG